MPHELPKSETQKQYESLGVKIARFGGTAAEATRFGELAFQLGRNADQAKADLETFKLPQPAKPDAVSIPASIRRGF